MEGEKDSPPSWPQLTTTLVRRRRPTSPAILNPMLLIILFPALALLVVFLLLPNLLSHTSQILRLNSVKNGWDLLNILLVLFAIVCGVLARQTDEGSSTVEADGNVASSVSFISKKHQSNSTEWFERSDRKEYDSRQVGTPETGAGRLRRNGCWYPDLRQDRWWETAENSLPFFDDFQVNMYRSSASNDVPRRPQPSQPESDDSVAKLIPADTFVNRDFSLPKKSPAPPPPPLPLNRKPKRSSGDVAFEDKVEKRSSCTTADFQKSRSGPLPPPAPPQQAAVFLGSLRKTAPTKDIGTTIASLYNHRKGKKGTIKNVDDNANHSPPSTNSIPPPPPSSMFHNPFKKGSKNKTVHPTPPPPPPPLPLPPRRSVFDTIFKNGSKSWRFRSDAPSPRSPTKPLPSVLSNILKKGTKSKRFQSTLPTQSTTSCKETQSPTAPPPPSSDYSPQRIPVAAGRSPLPTKTSTYHNMNNKMSSGMQSPLIPTTLPPPPLPPVKGPELKFVACGELFNKPCTHSPSCSSPKLEDTKESSNVMDGGDAISSVFCPSPDVNFKADTFIARRREAWRLEKMNSFKERQNMG